MGDAREVIILCSVGNLGKYLCDQLIIDGRYHFVVVSRTENKGVFFESRKIDVRASDYSTSSILKILDDTNATTFISFNNSEGQLYVDLHSAFLEACRKSRACKRFIPSEFAGNIDDFPQHPSYFQSSRVPFREILEQETEIEWTIFNNAWLMNYLLPDDRSYMPTDSDEFVINPNRWTALIRGSGDDIQSFTCGQDIAKAIIMLIHAPAWERRTYIVGQWATFNDVIRIFERFHNRMLQKRYRTKENIENDKALPLTAENMEKRYLASVEEMMITGAGSLPPAQVYYQRETLFEGLRFATIEEFLEQNEGS